MTITANWGLGETVVSGVAEPDTVVVTCNRDDLTMTEVMVGSKLVREVCDEEGNIEKVRREEPDDSCCLTEAEALTLARVALRLDRWSRTAGKSDLFFVLSAEKSIPPWTWSSV